VFTCRQKANQEKAEAERRARLEEQRKREEAEERKWKERMERKKKKDEEELAKLQKAEKERMEAKKKQKEEAAAAEKKGKEAAEAKMANTAATTRTAQSQSVQATKAKNSRNQQQQQQQQSSGKPQKAGPKSPAAVEARRKEAVNGIDSPTAPPSATIRASSTTTSTTSSSSIAPPPGLPPSGGRERQTSTGSDSSRQQSYLGPMIHMLGNVNLNEQQVDLNMSTLPEAEVGRMVGGSQNPAGPPPIPRFCSQCGFRLVAGARFCSNCGVPVSIPTVLLPPQPPVASNVVGPPPSPPVSPAVVGAVGNRPGWEQHGGKRAVHPPSPPTVSPRPGSIGPANIPPGPPATNPYFIPKREQTPLPEEPLGEAMTHDRGRTVIQSSSHRCELGSYCDHVVVDDDDDDECTGDMFGVSGSTENDPMDVGAGIGLPFFQELRGDPKALLMGNKINEFLSGVQR